MKGEVSQKKSSENFTTAFLQDHNVKIQLTAGL